MQRDPLTRWLLGLFGGVGLFLLLPRAVRFVLKTFVLGVLSEVVTVVVAGLLTAKAAESVGGNHRAEEPVRIPAD